MANLFTSTASGSLGGTAGSAGLVQTAYDLLVEQALRDATMIADLADKHPTNQTIPGSTVILQTYVDLAVNTTPLTETVDPDSVSLATPTSVAITLAEYGLSTIVTRAFGLFSMKNVDPDIANIIAYNIRDTMDAVAMTPLRGGTNVMYAGATATSTATVTAAATITSANLRKIHAKLEVGKAIPRFGDDLFWAGIHPEVAHDLRAETGALGWILPQQYGADQTNLWRGSIGLYEGFNFVKSNRMYNATDGAASARVYRTIFAGAQALAASFAEDPHVVIGEVVDRLKRLRPIGWYGVGGFARYRENCLYRLESGSSIAS